MPLAATKHTPAGAAAFAKFFIQTIDWAYATTSTTYMRHYFQHSCVACLSTADAVDQAKRAGHHFDGDRFRIRQVVPASPRGAELSAMVHFDVESAEVVTASGAFVNGLPAYPDFRERAFVQWQLDHWTVVEMIPGR
jgi:hypothetical protein